MNLNTGLSKGYAADVIQQPRDLKNNPIHVLWVGGDGTAAHRAEHAQSQGSLSVTFKPVGYSPDLLPDKPTIFVVESSHGPANDKALALISRVQCLPHLRSIWMTPRDHADDRVTGYKAGADMCLSKSVDERLLLAVIKQKWDRLQELPH